MPDFRVSDYYGRFMEGDTDVDGDEIENVLDPAPFDASPSPVPAAGLPAHLDWARQARPPEMVRIQRQLFVDHGIALVERSAQFTPELARAVHDTVTRVYASVFRPGRRLATLRVIATEESSLLFPDAEEGASDFAQVLPATRTMEIYRRGIDAGPVIQLGFLVHEIGHTIQFAMDYGAAEREAIVRHNHFDSARFHALVQPYGWTSSLLPDVTEGSYALFRPQYDSAQAIEYRYLGETPDEWSGWLQVIYDEVGEAAYLTDERMTDLHILGDYSLTNPWEWYSDHLIAYLYLAMLDALGTRCTPGSLEGLSSRFQERIVASEWPYFRFENARGAPVQADLAQAYPISHGDMEHLVDVYLESRLSDLCAR